LDISANLYVERSSQKGIVIGHQGSRLRQVGTNARQQIEALLGTPVYLDLHVKIAKDWQRDPTQLRKLGFGPPSRHMTTRRVSGVTSRRLGALSSAGRPADTVRVTVAPLLERRPLVGPSVVEGIAGGVG